MKQEPDFSRAFGHADRAFAFAVRSTLEELKNREDRKMKKKATAALIAVIVILILAMGTALALSLGWGHIEKAMDLMVENGAYWEWSLEAKAKLIEAMRKDGVGVAEKDWRALEGNELTEQEKHALADRILTEYYGDEQYLYYFPMAEAEWGQPETWTLEQRHWFWNKLREKGLYGDGFWIDELPEKSDLPREEVIAIARRAVAGAYGLTEEEINAYYPNVSFFTTESCATPRWMVEFHTWDRETGHIFGSRYSTLLTREGQVTEDPSEGWLTPENARRMEEEQQRNAVDVFAQRGQERLKDTDTVYCSPDGGKYYHFLKECPLVMEKRLSLTATDKTAEAFKRLEACPVCVNGQEFWTVADKLRYRVGAWQAPEDGWIGEEEAADIARTALERQGIDLTGLYPAVYTSAETEEQGRYVVYFAGVSLGEAGDACWEPAYTVILEGCDGTVVSAGEAGGNG